MSMRGAGEVGGVGAVTVTVTALGACSVPGIVLGRPQVFLLFVFVTVLGGSYHYYLPLRVEERSIRS